ncbi:hypothetical protein E2I00_010593, partial [Balaenoptera physalus]
QQLVGEELQSGCEGTLQIRTPWQSQRHLLREKQSSGEKNAMATMTELSPTAGKYSQDVQGDEKLSPGKAPSLCSTRYGIAFITYLCNFIIMAQNVIMNITMVTVANSTNHQSQFNSSTEGLPVDSFDDPNNSPKSLPVGAPVYDWSPQIQGIIFSSINYGMILTLAPSGYLAGGVGTKRVLSDLGLGFLIATRILQGGLRYGGQFALWERWSPTHERSRLCSIAFSGLMPGSCIAILLGGIISQALGWPFVFYIFGGVGCVSCLLWFVLIYDDPVTHPWINITEKEYIISSLAQLVHIKTLTFSRDLVSASGFIRVTKNVSALLSNLFPSKLWSDLYPSGPCVFAVSAINVLYQYKSGFLSALPFIFAWVVGILGGYLADFLLTKNFRLVTVRKIATVLGSLPSSASLVVLPYVASSYITAVSLLTLSCGLSLFSQPGIYINALDIAPSLEGDPEFGWRNVFSLSFAINTLGLILYLIFGKADVQDWAKERKRTHL